MTDTLSDRSISDGDGLLLTILFRLDGADLVSFTQYEAAVLPLIPVHGGSLERRIRTKNDVLEVHLVRFPDHAAFERYRADVHRLAVAPLLEKSRVAVELFEGRELLDVIETDIFSAIPEALDPRTTALVLIDVQLGFDDPIWGQRNNPAAEARIADLLATWRRLSGRVHHVQHASTEPNSPLRPSHPGHALKPEAQPRAGEPLYRKQVNSGFIGTSLEADLRAAAVTTVVLVGLTTNHCVSTTARMAANFGFMTIVVADATAAFDRPTAEGRLRPASEVHAGALSDLAGEFATISSAADVAAALDAGAVLRGSGRDGAPQPGPQHGRQDEFHTRQEDMERMRPADGADRDDAGNAAGGEGQQQRAEDAAPGEEIAAAPHQRGTETKEQRREETVFAVEGGIDRHRPDDGPGS